MNAEVHEETDIRLLVWVATDVLIKYFRFWVVGDIKLLCIFGFNWAEELQTKDGSYGEGLRRAGQDLNQAWL